MLDKCLLVAASFVIVWLVMVSVAAEYKRYIFEKKQWNKGKCPCGGIWLRNATSYLRPERIYTCSKCKRQIAIYSYVDKLSDEELDKDEESDEDNV